MYAIINNHKYSLVYMDTNALSYLIKYDEFAKKILEKYGNGCFGFCTGVYNIIELNRLKPEYRAKIKDRLGNIPFFIIDGYEQLLYVESKIKMNLENFVILSIGDKPLFHNNFEGLFKFIDNSQEQLKKREELVNKEIESWKEKKENKNKKWQKNFIFEITETMKEIASSAGLDIPLDDYLKNEALLTMAFIKNKFCFDKEKYVIKQNCIFDMYNVSSYPYVDVYITEKTVGQWLNELKTKLPQFTTIIEFLSDYYIPPQKGKNKE